MKLEIVSSLNCGFCWLTFVFISFDVLLDLIKKNIKSVNWKFVLFRNVFPELRLLVQLIVQIIFQILSMADFTKGYRSLNSKKWDSENRKIIYNSLNRFWIKKNLEFKINFRIRRSCCFSSKYTRSQIFFC